MNFYGIESVILHTITKMIAVDIVKCSGTCAIFTILLGGKSMNHGVTAPLLLKCTDLCMKYAGCSWNYIEQNGK